MTVKTEQEIRQEIADQIEMRLNYLISMFPDLGNPNIDTKMVLKMFTVDCVDIALGLRGPI